MHTRSKWLLLSVGLGILLNPLNSSMISVAIPRLQLAFERDYADISWLIFAFYIASAIAQPVMGKASDLFGRRKIFLAGLALSFVISLLAPLSPDFGCLVAARVVQAIGTSMMVAVGMAIVRIHITEKQASALSVISIFLSGAAAIGPFVGGSLIAWWDWHAIFFVNLPFIVASFLLAWIAIPKDETSAAASRKQSVRSWLAMVDAPGILYFTIGLVALLVGLLSANASRHFSLGNSLAGLIGLAALGSFVLRELNGKTKSPFIPLRAFAEFPALTWVNIQYVLVNLLFYALFFGLPSYLQTVRHLGEFHTGMLMLSLGLCSLVSSPFAGRWVDRSGPRPALLLSVLLMTFGSVWLLTLNANTPVIGVTIALAAFGISNGMNAVCMQAALFASSPKTMIGVASGLFNTSRYLGTILSSLLTSIVMGKEFSAGGFKSLAIALSAISLVLLLISLRRRQTAVASSVETRLS